MIPIYLGKKKPNGFWWIQTGYLPHGAQNHEYIEGYSPTIDVFSIYNNCTLPETNIAPKNGWLEYYLPIGEAYFQGLC